MCCRGGVITHQGETVHVGALLTFPVTSPLTFAVNQKHRKMAAAGDEGEGISAWNESAIASGLKRIPPKPHSPCKCSCNVHAKSPYPPKSMWMLPPEPVRMVMYWVNRRNIGWCVCLSALGLFAVASPCCSVELTARKEILCRRQGTLQVQACALAGGSAVTHPHPHRPLTMSLTPL